jgi:hypothetical protein
MTAAACGGAVAGGPGRDSNSSATFVPPYGGMPADASTTGVMDPSGGVPAYGGFFPSDAGGLVAEDANLADASADGGETFAALYGAFYVPDASLPEGTDAGSADAAPQDASDDHPSVAPAYGLPPR